MTSGSLASILVAVTVAGVAFVVPARADDAACIAASEAVIPMRKDGKLHDALTQLAVCASATCPAEVRAECVQRIEAVKASMPTLILGAKDTGGNDRRDVAVTVDGAPLPGALDGRAIDLDPGEHTLRFELAGQPSQEKKVVLRQGEKDRRETVVIGPAPPAPPSFWTTRRTLAVVSAGLGVVGLGIGAAFGGYAISSQSAEKSACSASTCASYPIGVEDYNTAQKNATGATVGLAVGGVLAATGVVLWFTAPTFKPGAPPPSARAVRVAPLLAGGGWSPAGLTLGVDL